MCEKITQRNKLLKEKALRKRQRFYPDEIERSLILAFIRQHKNKLADLLFRESEETLMLDIFSELLQLNNYEPIEQSTIKKYLYASFGEDA